MVNGWYTVMDIWCQKEETQVVFHSTDLTLFVCKVHIARLTWSLFKPKEEASLTKWRADHWPAWSEAN